MNNEAHQKCLSILERTEYYDNEGEWRIAGSDWLLMSGSTLRSWTKVTEQILGSRAEAAIYMIGKHAGERFVKRLLKAGFKGKELKCSLEVFLTNWGWGKVWTKVNPQKQMAVVRIRNSVTARRTNAKKPVCHFISGYVAGALGVVLGKEVECVETRCKAKGDAICEFRVDGSGQIENCKS